MKKVRIGITGLNNTDNPAPGYGVIKSLLSDRILKKQIEIIGLSYDPMDSINFLPEVKEVYTLPFPNQGKDILFDILKDINLDIIIPNLDAELPLYIKYQKELEEKLNIKVMLPDLVSFKNRNKDKLDKFIKKIRLKNLKYPNTFTCNSIEDILKLINERKIYYPFFIKGIFYKAYKINNIEELYKYFYKITNEWGYPVIIQEYIKIDSEINFVGIGDGKNLISGVSMKKLTTTDLGKVWNALSIKDKQLESLARQFVKKYKWKGPFELECIRSSDNLYLIEINPRFPAWLHFATMLGINLPAMLVKEILNIPYKRKKTYPLEKLYFRYVEENIIDYKYYLEILIKKQLKK